MNKFICVLLLTTNLFLACAAQADTNPMLTQSVGGSNFHWYKIEDCKRERFGVVPNYDQARPEIKKILQDMYTEGQRRLRLGIYFAHGLSTGTVIDSSQGGMNKKIQENLKNLLSDVKAIGYSEILFSLFPVASSRPWDHEFDETRFQENWHIVNQAHEILASSGLPYKMDLLNEGTPDPSQKELIIYTQRVWRDYVKKYGKKDTVGFSIIGNSIPRIKEISVIYGGDYPYLFEFHFYNTPKQSFIDADTQMKAMGLKSEGWVIGETYYQDSTTETALAEAIKQTGRKVFYAIQWPLTTAKKCPDVDVTPPTQFSPSSKLGL